MTNTVDGEHELARAERHAIQWALCQPKSRDPCSVKHCIEAGSGKCAVGCKRSGLFCVPAFPSTTTILISLDIRQGRERWRRPLNGMLVGELKWNRNGSIAIVTATRRIQRSYRGVVRRSVSPTTGRVLRETSVERARRRSWDVPNPPAHALALQWQGSVLHWGDSSQFQAFNKTTQKELWRFKHPRWAKPSKGGASRGRRARRSQPWFFPPLFSGKIVLLGGNFARLYALRAATGQILWKTRACSWGVKPLVAVGGVVLFSDLDRTAYAVDRRTGKTLWKVVEEERTTGQGEEGIISHGAAGVVVDKKGLYLASRNEVLYGYRFAD